MTTSEKITLSTIALAALAMLVLLGGVSDEDIARCQTATNYSAERCQVELGR